MSLRSPLTSHLTDTQDGSTSSHLQPQTASNPTDPISKSATAMRSSGRKSSRKSNSRLWRPSMIGVARPSTKKPSVAKLVNRFKIEMTHSLPSKDVVLASRSVPPCLSGGIGIPRRSHLEPSTKSLVPTAIFLPIASESEIEDPRRVCEFFC